MLVRPTTMVCRILMLFLVSSFGFREPGPSVFRLQGFRALRLGCLVLRAFQQQAIVFACSCFGLDAG